MMIHFFGILQPVHPRTDGDEAPFKRRSFGGTWLKRADASDRLTGIERDSAVLSGNAPAGIAENARDDRFVSLAFPPFL